MMKYFAIIFLYFLSVNLSFAQEFKMNVKVQAPSLKIADNKTIKQMEETISDFYNNSKWTSDTYEEKEKIESSLIITITNDFSATTFQANFAFQCLRPVFNANYKTMTFNWVEKDFKFTYEELQPINISTNVFIDDISALLTFYGYYMLGLDYDSFSSSGGTRYFDKAREVVDNIPAGNQNLSSWAQNGKESNKYWLIENMMNVKYRSFHSAFYEYHRQGLDIMSDNIDKGRAVINSSLKEFNNIAKLSPQNPIISLFVNCKKGEIVEIFLPSGSGQRNSIYSLVSEMDPNHIEDYKKLIN